MDPHVAVNGNLLATVLREAARLDRWLEQREEVLDTHVRARVVRLQSRRVCSERTLAPAALDQVV